MKKQGRFSTKMIILIPVFVIGIISIISSVLAVKNIRKVNENATQIANGYMVCIADLGSIQIETEKIHRLGLSHIVATDLDSMISLVDVIRSEQTVLDEYLSDFEQFIDDSDRENYEAILSNYEGLKYENANLMAYSANGNKEAAYALANGAISEYADKIDQNIMAIQEVVNNNADTAKQQLTKVYKYSLTVSFVTIAVSTASLLFAVFSVLKMVIVPLSKTKNEITDLKSHANVLSLISGNGFGREGYPVRGLFSIPFAGLTEDGLPTFINQDGQKTISSFNFQEYEKLDFLKYEGPAAPTNTGSFGNILTYKNLKLNVFVTYSFGNVIRLDPVFSNAYSDLDAMPKEFKNRWMKAGDENVTNIPTIVSTRMNQQYAYLNMAYNAYNYSDVRIADGGFIRLKEISLSYDLPAKVINFFRLNKLQLKLQATNLCLLYADSKLNGQDPEFFRSGGVSTPVPKQFTFTVRLGL